MLRKKESFTTITPIPKLVPRQLALDILHSHSEVITLNPLVLDHKPIAAPRFAATDEYYCAWYEITEKIQFVPGIGSLGSGKVTSKACFHDTPWGLQTHVYAPFHINARSKYRVAGNQPGIEPPSEEHDAELEALGAPKDGLYLREDIELRCNVAMAGLITSQAKAASKLMVERIVKKAELLDTGILQAMVEDGKLRTINPNDRSQLPYRRESLVSPILSPIGSPHPGLLQPHNGPYQMPRSPMHRPRQICQARIQNDDISSHECADLPPAVELPGDSQQHQYFDHQPYHLGREHSGNFLLGYRQSLSSSDTPSSEERLSSPLAGTHRSSVCSSASSAGSMHHVFTALACELAADTETKVEKN